MTGQRVVRMAGAVAALVVSLGLGARAHAAVLTWDGAADIWPSIHWTDEASNLVAGGSNPADNYVIPGGTVTFAGNDTFGNAGTPATPAISIGTGGTLASGGWYNTMINLNLDGGTLLSNGGVNTNYGSFGLKGTVTVTGSAASSISTGAGNFNTISLGSGAAGNSTVFNVADVTADGTADLTIATTLQNYGGTTQSGLTKSGAGTLTLSGNTIYTGATLVNGGTLDIAAGAVVSNSNNVNAVSGGTLSISGTVTVANNGRFGVGSGIANTTGAVTVNDGGVLNIGNGLGFVGVGGNNAGSGLGAGTLTINAGGIVNVAAGGTSGGPLGLDVSHFWLNPYGNGGASSIVLNGGTLSTARGIANGSSNNSVVFNGGTLQAAGNLGTFFQPATATINEGGATIDTQDYTVTAAAPIGGVGSLTKIGSGTLTLGNSNPTMPGNTFTGNLIINGGTLTDTRNANVTNPTATGLGDLTVPGRQIQVNSGGTLVLAANDAMGAANYTTPVEIIVDGGTLSHANNFVTVGNVTLKNGATMTGGNGVSPVFSTFSLRGTVAVSGASGSTINTTGTTNTGVNLGVSNVNFVVDSTGAGPDLTVAVPLINDPWGNAAGFTKSGAGTMLLTAASTYSGATTINDGSLLLNGGSLNAASSVSVADNATFGGNGAAGAVTVAEGGTLQAGYADVGNLSLTGLAFNGDSALNLAPISGSTASVAVSGAVNTSGIQTVNIVNTQPLAPGSYRLMSWSYVDGAGSDAFALGATPSDGGATRPRTYALDSMPAEYSGLGLIVSGDSPIWTGGNNGSWDTATTGNWKLASNGAATTYFTADAVQFNDTTGTRAVDISTADVTPGSVVFNNSAGNDYTLSGTHGIAGATSLVKSGEGTVTIANVNTYTGGTTINGGTLAYGANDALPVTGPLSITSGTLDMSTFNGAVGAVTLANGSITGTSGVLSAASFVVESGSISAILGGPGALTKTTWETVTLSGVNTYTGATNVNGGTLDIAAEGAVANTSRVNVISNAALNISGALSVANNGVFAIGASNGNSGTVIVNEGAVVNIGAGSGGTVGGTYIGGMIDAAGTAGTGSLILDGGTVNVAVGGNRPGGDGSRLWLNPWGGSGSSISLNGGTLSTARPIANGSGASSVATVNLNGGTLQAAGNINLLEHLGPVGPLTVYVQTGGAIVDTNGFNATIIAPLLSGTGETDGGLTKMGAGVLTLAGNNTYTGATTINAGELSIGSDANIGGPTSAINFNGGLLQVTGTAIANLDDHALNESTFNGGFNIATAGHTLTVNQSLGGEGGLTKTGPGMVVLTGNNAFSGGTTINAGTLSIETSDNIGGPSSAVTFNGGLLQVRGATLANLDSHAVNWSTFNGGFDIAEPTHTFTVSQTLEGPGKFTKAGAGTLVLSGVNTHMGGTAINGGILSVASDDNLGVAGGPVSFNGGTLLTTAAITTSRPITLNAGGGAVNTNGFDSALQGNITGPGGLTKSGEGTLTVSAANSYSGGTTVNGGTLKGSASSIRGNVSVTAATASVAFDQTVEAGFYGGVVSGSGGLTKTGGNSLTLFGKNTYAGTTTISEGTLKLGYKPSLWLDASDPNTLFQNGDGTVAVTGDVQPVGYWVDKSGNGKHAVQLTPENRPTYTTTGTTINDKPVVTFDGSNDDITSSLDINPASMPNMSLFILYRQVTDTLNSGLWGHDNGGWDRLQLLNFSGGGQFTGYPIAATNDRIPVNGMHTTVPLVYAAVLQDAVPNGSSVHLNGVADATTGLPAFTSTDFGGLPSITFGNISPGNGFRGNIQIAEILAYDMAMDQASREAIEAYLFTKWFDGGATSPDDHLPDASLVIVAGGATLDLADGMETIGPLDGFGAVTLGSGTLTINSVSESTFAGEISGTGKLVKTGPELQELAGVSSHTGGTEVREGTLLVSNANALTAGGALTIGSSGTVVLGSGLNAGGQAGTAQAAAVPEPGTLALVVTAALAGLVAWRRRK